EHPRRHVDADDAPAVADDSSGGQCRESGAGRGVQHVVARSEITQRDEPLRAEPMPWVLRVGWRAAVERPGDLPDVLHNWRLTKTCTRRPAAAFSQQHNGGQPRGRAMNPEREVDYMLQDCFLAVGQIIGTHKPVDADVLAWWRERYRSKFLEAMTERGTSWAKDRPRVLAVGRFLGTRAL